MFIAEGTLGSRWFPSAAFGHGAPPIGAQSMLTARPVAGLPAQWVLTADSVRRASDTP